MGDSRRRLHASCLAALALAAVAFFHRVVFQGEIFIPADVTHFDYPWNSYPDRGPETWHNGLINDAVLQSYPWRDLTAESWRKGRLPVWNAYAFSGSPLAANGQSGAFYPLSVIPWLIGAPPELAISWLAPLHVILGGAFMHLLIARLTREPAAGSIAGLAFAFNGWQIGWMARPEFHHTGAWTPGVLLFYFLAREGGPKTNAFRSLGGVLLGVQVLAGHFQIAFYSFLALGLVWALDAAAGLCGDWKEGSRRAVRSFASVAWIASAGLAISALLWIPALDLAARCTRGGAVPSPSGFFRFPGTPLREFVTLFAPEYFGNPVTRDYWGTSNYTETAMHCGVTAVCLAFLGLLLRRREAFIWKGLAALAFLLVIGSPLYAAVYYIFPFVRSFAVSRLLYLFTFAICAMSGFGAAALLRGGANAREKALSLGCAAAAFAFLMTWGKVWPGQEGAASGRGASSLGLAGVYFIAVGILYWSRVPARWKGALAAALVAVELIPWGMRYNTFSKREWLYPPLKIVDFLKSRDGLGRIHVVTGGRLFPSNSTAPYRLEDIRGYDSLYYRDYWRLLRAFQERRKTGSFVHSAFLNVSGVFPDLYRLTGVTHVLSTWDIERPELEKVYAGEAIAYRFKGALPRYRLVDRARLEPRGDILDRLTSGEVNLKDEIVLAEEDFPDGVPETDAAPSAGAGKVELQDWSPGDVLLSVKTDRPRWLYLSEVDYPGWAATVNGRFARLSRANGAFLALFVEKGDWMVRVYRNERIYPVGALLGLAVLAFSGAMVIRALSKHPNCQMDDGKT